MPIQLSTKIKKAFGQSDNTDRCFFAKQKLLWKKKIKNKPRVSGNVGQGLNKVMEKVVFCVKGDATQSPIQQFCNVNDLMLILNKILNLSDDDWIASAMNFTIRCVRHIRNGVAIDLSPKTQTHNLQITDLADFQIHI